MFDGKKENNMAKYVVSVKIDGRLDVEVDAESFEAAKELAVLNAGEQDWNRIEAVDIEAVNAEDENGEFRDF